MMQKQVTLLMPGYSLAGDDNILSAHASQAAFRFSRDARRQPWQASLADTLGLDTEGGKRLPLAQLNSPGVHKALVRADPISLKPDRDTAKLVSAQLLEMSETEADELLAVLNEFVADDGFRFFRHAAGEWYMSGMPADALESYPPSFLADRNASSFLPDGDAAAPWRRLMTEIQMLLHNQPVNDLREQGGLLPINSVWFWGGAPLPEAVGDNRKVSLFADDKEAVALAQHMGVACQPLSAFSADTTCASSADHVVVMDDSIVSAWLQTDLDRLEKATAYINEQWLQPLVEQVEKGTLKQVHIVTEDGLEGICDERLSWWQQSMRRILPGLKR